MAEVQGPCGVALELEDQVIERLQKARANLISSQPFFGSLAMRLKLVEDSKAKSTWTDGKQIAYNPAWANDTPLPEIEAVIAHHVLSCAWGHHLRRGERASKDWQEASDYVVNLELQRAGFQLPQGSLVDQQYDKMTVEQVFNVRKKPDDEGDDDDQQGGGSSGEQGQGAEGQQSPGNSGAAGDDSTGTCEDATDDTGDAPADDAERAEQAAEWKEAAAEAAQVARGAGRLPGGIERGVKDFLNSKVDWVEILMRYFTAKAKEDTSWTTRSRRSPDDIFLPGKKSVKCGPIYLAIDASGSISQRLFDRFMSEMQAIVTLLQPEKLVVMVFDTQVRQRYEFTSDEPVDIKLIAGGGTAFDDPIYEVERDGVTPEALVYLTDLDSRTFAPEPAFPVVWVSTMLESAPYGDVIMMEV